MVQCSASKQMRHLTFSLIYILFLKSVSESRKVSALNFIETNNSNKQQMQLSYTIKRL
jgi:hypothetical protein